MSVRNVERRNGKAWKQGKNPVVRAAEARVKRVAEAARRAAKKQ